MHDLNRNFHSIKNDLLLHFTDIIFTSIFFYRHAIGYFQLISPLPGFGALRRTK